VKIEILSENKTLLKPEMTANVQIVAAAKHDVLVVPTQAITRKDDNLIATVSKTAGATEERPVQVGMTDGANYEITSGLAEGETVMCRKGDADSKWRPDQPRPPFGGPMMFGPRGPGGGRGR
jgi:multidrug efflux pump subunit AcrA (membrane-fusion protein)